MLVSMEDNCLVIVSGALQERTVLFGTFVVKNVNIATDGSTVVVEVRGVERHLRLVESEGPTTIFGPRRNFVEDELAPTDVPHRVVSKEDCSTILCQRSSRVRIKQS